MGRTSEHPPGGVGGGLRMQGVPSCCCPCASGRRSFESCEEELVTGFGMKREIE